MADAQALAESVSDRLQKMCYAVGIMNQNQLREIMAEVNGVDPGKAATHGWWSGDRMPSGRSIIEICVATAGLPNYLLLGIEPRFSEQRLSRMKWHRRSLTKGW